MSQFVKWDIQASQVLGEPLQAPGVQLVSQYYWMLTTQKRITEQAVKALEPFTPPGSPGGVFYVVATSTKIVFFRVIKNFFTAKELGKPVLELPRNAFMHGGSIQVQRSQYATVHLRFNEEAGGTVTHYMMRCKEANLQRLEQNKHVWLK